MEQLPDPWSQPLLTIPQAAACLGISRRTAYRRVSTMDLVTVDWETGWRWVSTRWVYEELGIPIPPQPGAPAVFTLDTFRT